MSEKMYKTDKELQEKIEEYFTDHCGIEMDEDGVLHGKPPTVSGLALYLGFADRQSLYDYKNKPMHACTIKRAVCRIEEYAEQSLFSSKSPTGAIFWLKNHRWSDKQEVEHTGAVDISVKSWGEVMGGVEPETE